MAQGQRCGGVGATKKKTVVTAAAWKAKDCWGGGSASSLKLGQVWLSKVPKILMIKK